MTLQTLSEHEIIVTFLALALLRVSQKDRLHLIREKMIQERAAEQQPSRDLSYHLGHLDGAAIPFAGMFQEAFIGVRGNDISFLLVFIMPP